MGDYRKKNWKIGNVGWDDGDAFQVKEVLKSAYLEDNIFVCELKVKDAIWIEIFTLAHIINCEPLTNAELKEARAIFKKKEK